MRLTLRTLLAYLDDVLEPAETREIGQKIRESPAAAAMVSRIREAIRRRRLGAPDVHGPKAGIDPNFVAAYLDNTLSPEQVVELERICLEDDVQLAEVAACHQVLTLVMAEGREVPQPSLDRFYALGPMPFDERGPAHANGHTRAAAGLPTIVPTVSRLPAALKQNPWSQRVAPIMAVALIVIVAFLLLASDRELFRGLAQSARRTGGPAPSEPGAELVASADGAIPPSPAPATNEAASGQERDSVSAASALPSGLDPAPPPDLPEPTPPATVPATGAPLTKPTPAAPPPAVEPTAPLPEPVRVPIQYVSTDGVLLRFETSDQHWYVHPRRSEVHPEESFACPEPYEAQFDFDRGGFKVTLLSDSALDILPVTATSRQGLRLNRGRVLLQPGTTGGPERLDFTVQLGNRRFVLRFSGPQALCGVEVLLREPAGLDRPWNGDGFHAAVFVASGSVQIDSESDESPKLDAGQALVLTAAPWPAASGAFPPWLDPQRRQGSETQRRFAAQFEKEFDPTLAVDLSIPALAKDPLPKRAELAIRCLALIENYPSLVQGLAQSDHEEARAAAAQGLRLWLGAQPGRGPLLKRELEGRYSDIEGLELYRLLWGFTPDDAKDKIASADLVNWLRSGRTEIRELAFHELVQLTGRTYDYKPLAPPSQRELRVQRWLAHLDRNEGALAKAE